VLLFPDVRLKPGKWYGANWDPGGMDFKSKQFMLKITSRDPVTIKVKWIAGGWRGRWGGKVFMISNEVPNFNDPVLPTRFIKHWFGVNFEENGQLDINLQRKLTRELPGIARRCLEAYWRLIAREEFVEPVTDLEEDVNASSDWRFAFFRDRLVKEGEANCGEVFLTFRDWCNRNGQIDLIKKITPPGLSRELKKVVPKLWSTKLSSEPRRYIGIRLKTRKELDGEWA
jgi:hypothetical protein